MQVSHELASAITELIESVRLHSGASYRKNVLMENVPEDDVNRELTAIDDARAILIAEIIAFSENAVVEAKYNRGVEAPAEVSASREWFKSYEEGGPETVPVGEEQHSPLANVLRAHASFVESIVGCIEGVPVL